MWSEDVRQWHYLRCLRGDRVPAQWVLCDYLTEAQGSDPTGKVQALRLKMAGFMRCDLDGDMLVPVDTFYLGPDDDCLEGLKQLLSGIGCTWVMGYHVSALLELIGWWQEAQEGTITPRRPGSVCDEFAGQETSWSAEGSLQSTQGNNENCPCRQHQLESPYRDYVTTDPPLIVSCWWSGLSITIVDSRNYWPETPAQMATTLNMDEAKPIPTATDWSRMAHHLGWRLDALRMQLQETLVWWRETCKATWAATTPALAWSLWRRHHVPDRSILVHGDRLALCLERLGTYGGDCRVAYQGKVISEQCQQMPPPRSTTLPVLVRPSTVASLDARGLYPAIVSESPLPARLIGGRIGDRRITDLEKTDTWGGVAMCRVKTDLPYYPCRVMRNTQVPLLWAGVDPYTVSPHSKHQVIYPVGEFDTVLAGADLVRALWRGDITRVYYWCQYELADVASSYMRALHDERSRSEDEGEWFRARMCKLLANSLIGRWASWSRRWEDVAGATWEGTDRTWPSVNADTGEVRLRRVLAGVVQEQRPHGECENSLPILAACVTAAARWRMHLLREQIGHLSWYYQDTDGLLCDLFAAQSGVVAPASYDSRLGKLELRASDMAATILGKRCYWFGNQWVTSGVQACQWDEMEEEWVSEVTDGAATIMHRGPGSGVSVRTQRRVPRRTEVGARVRSDGWTEPWEVKAREK